MKRKCFICGGFEFSKIGSFNTYKVLECRKCLLQILDPIPDEKSLDRIYSDYYKSWELIKFQKEVSDMKAKTFQGYLDEITAVTSSGRFLDIGCATGEFMESAEKAGFDVYGIEISPFGILRCREKFGENKILGSRLKMGDFPSGFFDVITLSDVIEHITTPLLFLEIVHNILKPNGILMIVTPNTSSWTRKIMRKNWLHYKEEHVCYYNTTNITSLLSSYFNTINIKPAYKTLTINYINGVILAYLNKGLLKKIAYFLDKFPYCMKFRDFRINIGEMIVLCRKK